MLSWNWCYTCWIFLEAVRNMLLLDRIGMHRILMASRLAVLMVGLLAGLLSGQQQPPQQQPPQPAGAEPGQSPAVFRSSVSEVQAPVLVLDRDGQYVNGLQPEQFHLFDNGKEQNIHVDVSY